MSDVILYSKDAEESVLGSALVDPSVIPNLCLEASDFYDDRHKWIYRAVRRLEENGTAIDVVTLKDQLEKDGKLKESGGAAYLVALINATTTVLNVHSYAKIVGDYSRRRRRQLLINKLAKLNLNGSDPDKIRDVLENFENTLPRESLDSWKPYTLLDAYQDREPRKHVVDGLLTLPSLCILYAPPGELKTFLVEDLAICVAGGLTWLQPAPWKEGALGMKTLHAPVMWLDFDNGSDIMHERFSALGKAYGLPGDIPLFYYSMPEPWLNATDKSSIEALILRAIELGVKLICIDNLLNVSGGVEENSSAMSVVMSSFRQLAERTGAAVLLIHHPRKASGIKGRAGDSLRGHSSIEAAIDLGLLIEREENSDVVVIRSTKTRGAEVLPFSAAFTYENVEKNQLKSARFYGLPFEDTSSGAAIESGIKTALLGTSMNKTQLTNAVKERLPDIGTNRIRDKIDQMVSLKKIKVKSGERTEKICSLP